MMFVPLWVLLAGVVLLASNLAIDLARRPLRPARLPSIPPARVLVLYDAIDDQDAEAVRAQLPHGDALVVAPPGARIALL